MCRLVIFAIFVNLANIVTAFSEKACSCILPPFPRNGNYTLLGDSTVVPGQSVHSYVLKVACDPGFQMVGDAVATCLQGLETDEIAECVPYCQWKTAKTIKCGVQDTCYLQSTAPVNPGLRKRHLENKICGKIVVRYSPIMAGGRDAHTQEVPWHAGIYSKVYMPYKQICGGSLVSNTVVISAAHCFWNDELKQLPAEDYAVAVGKVYRPWNDPNEEDAQKSDVKQIKIPPLFLGSAANFQEDLALLILTTPVHFTNAVHPVCLDFDYGFDSRQLESGALGRVAGWGLTSEDGKAAPTLQTAWVPYIPIDECVSRSDPAFRTFLTGDKICAGYTNGTAVCKGDSGGGLSFPSSTRVPKRYYLRGVVSTAPQSDHRCSVYSWAAYTHLIRHQHFIEAVLEENPSPVTEDPRGEQYKQN